MFFCVQLLAAADLLLFKAAIPGTIVHREAIHLPWILDEPSEKSTETFRNMALSYLQNRADQTYDGVWQVELKERDVQINMEFVFGKSAWVLERWNWNRGNPPREQSMWDAKKKFQKITKQYDRLGRLISSTIVESDVVRKLRYSREDGKVAESIEIRGDETQTSRYFPSGRAAIRETRRLNTLIALDRWWIDGLQSQLWLRVDGDRRIRAKLSKLDSQDRPFWEQHIVLASTIPASFFILDEKGILDYFEKFPPEIRIERSWDSSGRLIYEQTRSKGIRTELKIQYDPRGRSESTFVQGIIQMEQRLEGDEKITTKYRNGQALLRVYEKAGFRYKEEDLAGAKVLRTRHYRARQAVVTD
jgi:hypothetical protein